MQEAGLEHIDKKEDVVAKGAAGDSATSTLVSFSQAPASYLARGGKHNHSDTDN